jgi:Uma2 family endonuclease
MSLARKLDRPATLADLEALPSSQRGEIIEGTLYALPRPRFAHTRVEGRIYGDLDGPFDRGRGGPGGWWILIEPGIELPGSPEVAPDVAGWRRERMPRPPRKGESIQIVPDWICEVLSPRTRGYDNLVKKRYYAKIGVPHLWYVDPDTRSLQAMKLVEGRWLELGTWGEDEVVRAEPFGDVEIALAGWFEGLEEEE